MSEHVTAYDAQLGYSSEPDEYEPERGPSLLLKAQPCEIYVGNTGKVSFETFYQLFKQHGSISDMSFWRTHDHLYHARLTYRKPEHAARAIKNMNNQLVNKMRIRVSFVAERISLVPAAAMRIDGISADVTEEDIYDHFCSCGKIRFVIKIGNGAYVQFEGKKPAAKGLAMNTFLNGKPYTLSRISTEDWVHHSQMIENMKDVKYRKPFVMVENYPALPQGTPLYHYKDEFEALGTVRHFKIAPTAGGTVTLALCMDRQDDRALVVDRFNGAFVAGRQLKLYMIPGRARMLKDHVHWFANPESSIVVRGIRPYFTDYDVCKLFGRCGPITFLERIDDAWTICFDNPLSAASALSFYTFTVYGTPLEIQSVKVVDVETVKQNLWQIIVGTSLAAVAARQVNQIRGFNEAVAKLRQSVTGTKATPVKEPQTSTSAAGYDSDVQLVSDPQDIITIDSDSSMSSESVVPVPVEDNGPDAQPASDTQTTTTIDSDLSMSLQPKKRPAEGNGRSAQPTNVRQTDTELGDPAMNEPSGISIKDIVALSNLPKGIVEYDLHELFRAHKLENVSLYCSESPYHPSSVAFVSFTCKTHAKTALLRHHELYRMKRICVQNIQPMGWYFMPETSVMLKNLSKDVNEESIIEELEKLKLKMVDVLKPAHHYAYVDFGEDFKVNKERLAELQEAMMPFKIDVFPLYRRISKTWMHVRSFDVLPIGKMRAKCGAVLKEDTQDADGRFGAHNAHKLFVGNIARDTRAEDVIDYFNNFGNVVDYAPIEKMSCYLRRAVMLTFVDSRHAQNAYRQQPHCLEGSQLDVHLMDTPPAQFPEFTFSNFLTVKTHSQFLTNDEICEALRDKIVIQHHIRFNAFDDRANCFITYKSDRGNLESVLKIEYINDEAVKIVEGHDPTPPTEDEAREKDDIAKSTHRQQKEEYLNFTIYKENLKDEMEMTSKPNRVAYVPFESFYDDTAVQINNVALDTTVEDLRNLFVKCGDIVDYRAFILGEDGTKICYVKFKTDLAADLACTYSQRMVNMQRILVHLAKETLVVERDRSVLVERLHKATTAEQLHDAFSAVGMVKYVQKQSPHSAIVCFNDKNSVPKVVNEVNIPNSTLFTIKPYSRLKDHEYDPRFYNNFSCQEEVIPNKLMRAALKPRILPEFHQLELDQRVFESLPRDIQGRLLDELILAYKLLPRFKKLSKPAQITALRTRYATFTLKEHFLRLTTREREKLLDLASNPQQCKALKDRGMLPPAPKQIRVDQALPVSTSKESNLRPLQQQNASNVAQMFPTTDGLHGSLGTNGTRLQMHSTSGNMWPQEGRTGSQFSNMYSQQGPSQFSQGMSPFAGLGPSMGGMGQAGVGFSSGGFWR